MIVPINKTTIEYNLRGQLREVRKITAMRNGFVWATEFVGFVVAASYDVHPCVDKSKGELCSPSTRDSKLLIEAARRVKK